MKNQYLGETIVDIQQSEFKEYTPSDWAMYFISQYGQIDGSHHKLWVLDSVAQVLNGTPVIVKEASWLNGEKEFRITLGEPSEKYKKWVDEMKCDGEYDYDEGIAP